MPKKSKKHIILRLGKYLMQFKWLLLLAMLLSIGGNLLSLLGPKFSGLAISGAEGGAGNVDFNKVFYYAGLMLASFVGSALMTYALSTLMIYISQKVIYQMRKDVFESLLRLPVSYFDTHQAGDIISHISYDIDTVNTSLSSDLVQICTSIITVVGSFIMMVTISPILVLVFVFTIPMSILLTKYMTGKTRPLFRARSAALGRMNGFVEEMISGQRTIKAYNQENKTIEKFDNKNEEAVAAYYKAEYYGSMVGPSVNFINNLSLSLITVFGALIYLAGSISLGNISSFVLYSRKFSGPINEAANIISEFQSALAAAERVFKVIDEAPEKEDAPEAKELTQVRGNVKLQNVSFGYNADKLILKNVNIDAAAGKMIAVVGPTGSGKTTI
ncbi:MAG: ABC transporter transmembrane domain-containing protein, partial [Lachnospiraceae bacterium]